VTPEFSRPERVDTIGAGPRTVTIEADAAERAALAARFGLLSLDALAATFTLARAPKGISAVGTVTAKAVQPCSVTGAPVPAQIDEPVSLRFVPEADAAEAELELSEEDLDVLAYEGGAIDLGEAAAETMALALDPFPRAADAEQALRDAGVLSEEEAGPFSALAALKDRLGK